MGDENRNKARRPDLEQAPRIQSSCSALQVFRERKWSLVVRFGSDLFLLFKQTSIAGAPFFLLFRAVLPPHLCFSSLFSPELLVTSPLRRRPPTHNFPPRRVSFSFIPCLPRAADPFASSCHRLCFHAADCRGRQSAVVSLVAPRRAGMASFLTMALPCRAAASLSL